MASLNNSLKELRKRTANGQWFTADKDLRKFLSRDRILQHLPKCGAPLESLADLLDLILNRAIKVFAILVRSNQESMTVDCIENELFDDKLPLDDQFPGLMLSGKFFKIQWEFMAPILTRRNVVLKLRDQHILPFLEDFRIDNAHGGYANAFRVRLDPEHQDLFDVQGGDENCLLFRKELRLKDSENWLSDKNFREEDRILKILRHTRNENIIQIYISYQHRGVHNFLFPLADGDLSGFLTSKNRPKLFETDASIIKALHGLSTAIADVHNFDSVNLGVQLKGCHHDLKPQNILVSKGRFVLADFGLSRLKALHDDSTSVSKNIGDYLAPECRDPENRRQLIGRKSDIWSFGCIIAEVLAFLAGGAEGVERFWASREAVVNQWTNHSFHSSGILKTSVSQWLTEMSDNKTNSNFALVSDLVRQMLRPNPASRPHAIVVQRALCSLEAKSLFDESLRQYQSLAIRLEDPYLTVEGERLRAWGFAVGLFQTQRPWLWQTCQVDLLNEPSRLALQSISDELRSVQLMSTEQTDTVVDTISGTGIEVESLSEMLLDDGKLRTYNDRLAALLNPLNQKKMNRFHFRNVLRTNSPDNVQLIESQIVLQWQSGYLQQMQALAQLKLIYEIARQKVLSGDLKNMLPPNAKIEVTGTIEHHALGKYKTDDDPVVDVLIEWRPVNSPTQEISEELIHRIDALAGLSSVSSRPPEIRVLDCLGYYLDKDRRAFGMIYKFPDMSKNGKNDVQTVPISLFQLISSTSTSSGMYARPFLGERFAIAGAVASCVLYSHSIGWLHERLNSFNIVFFPSAGASLSQASHTLPFNSWIRP